MARLTVLALVLVSLTGCGGGDAAADCDDDAFVAQEEELYVAQATIANAIAGQARQEAIAEDLRRGADVLATVLDEARPCDPELVELRDVELASLARMYEAADAFERGDDPPRAELTRASADLMAVEERLVARKG
jgi:hypothetical protein